MFRSSHEQRQPGPAVSDAGQAPVVVYGTSWCAATQMVRRYLDREGIPYVFRDMDRDPQAAAQVKWWNGGYASHPTVQVGGQILVEPSTQELRWALSQEGIL
jgi:mycoredoxin